MKYIVITASKDIKPGERSQMRFPFVFPNMLVHGHVAKLASLLISLMYPSYDVRATSAGEINSMDFEGECYGESTTLNLKSDAGDTNLLRMNDYGSSMTGI